MSSHLLVQYALLRKLWFLMIVVLPRLKETRFQLEKTPEVMEEDVLIKKKTRKYTLCLSTAP
jgi:hypothetical protein